MLCRQLKEATRLRRLLKTLEVGILYLIIRCRGSLDNGITNSKAFWFNEIKEAEKADVPDTDTNNATTENVVIDEVNVHEENVSEDNELALLQIQKRYNEYLDRFQEDIAWLISKDFLQDDEDVTGKIHSDLQNCLEKFKGIKSIMENMQVDDLDDKSIVINR